MCVHQLIDWAPEIARPSPIDRSWTSYHGHRGIRRHGIPKTVTPSQESWQPLCLALLPILVLASPLAAGLVVARK